MVPIGSPKLPFTPPFRDPFAPFRPSRIGTGNYDHVFVCIFCINGGIQTFREPFAALSQPFATAAKTHVHICRCHSYTKSLAWVLERLPLAWVLGRLPISIVK